MSTKPFAQSAEQNRHAILAVLQKELHAGSHVLELGSGTGQHVCHFATALPGTRWQPSELASNLGGIELWLAESGCQNIAAPVELDVRWTRWPVEKFDACYSANTLHIAGWDAVESLLAGCCRVLVPGGKLLVYGPFSIDGEHTSPGNERFDQMLRAGDPHSGVRDISDLDQVATANGLNPARLVEMPVNNFIAVWEKPG